MREIGNGIGLVSDEFVKQVPSRAEEIRQRAAELEGSGRVDWTGRGTQSHPKGTGKHPVKIKMPSGQVIVVGGEALVSALANGGQPVE